jgi:hypothetical protein
LTSSSARFSVTRSQKNLDYFLGQESSEIMAKVGEFVNRPGIYPPIAGADHVASKFVQMVSMTADEYAKKKEEYRQIFRR